MNHYFCGEAGEQSGSCRITAPIMWCHNAQCVLIYVHIFDVVAVLCFQEPSKMFRAKRKVLHVPRIRGGATNRVLSMDSSSEASSPDKRSRAEHINIVLRDRQAHLEGAINAPTNEEWHRAGQHESQDTPVSTQKNDTSDEEESDSDSSDDGVVFNAATRHADYMRFRAQRLANQSMYVCMCMCVCLCVCMCVCV
jgi:hypothetical protein